MGKGKELQKASDTVNDPKCSPQDCEAASKLLNEASDDLRSNKALMKTIMSDTKKATSSFRPWEQVGEVYITLEPFAMVNGLLTQSFKVKRNFVVERYSDVL